jgi:hypothetical protein
MMSWRFLVAFRRVVGTQQMCWLVFPDFSIYMWHYVMGAHNHGSVGCPRREVRGGIRSNLQSAPDSREINPTRGRFTQEEWASSPDPLTHCVVAIADDPVRSGGEKRELLQ